MAVACQKLLPPSATQRLANLQEEIQFEVLRLLHQTPEVRQRTLAREVGHQSWQHQFCFQALVEKGWIKMQNFSQSKNKLRYAYLLTPAGVAEKSKLPAAFLQRKLAEYEDMQKEIEQLKSEISGDIPEKS